LVGCGSASQTARGVGRPVLKHDPLLIWASGSEQVDPNAKRFERVRSDPCRPQSTLGSSPWPSATVRCELWQPCGAAPPSLQRTLWCGSFLSEVHHVTRLSRSPSPSSLPSTTTPAFAVESSCRYAHLLLPLVIGILDGSSKRLINTGCCSKFWIAALVVPNSSEFRLWRTRLVRNSILGFIN
jgi:hypothetical protein